MCTLSSGLYWPVCLESPAKESCSFSRLDRGNRFRFGSEITTFCSIWKTRLTLQYIDKSYEENGREVKKFLQPNLGLDPTTMAPFIWRSLQMRMNIPHYCGYDELHPFYFIGKKYRGVRVPYTKDDEWKLSLSSFVPFAGEITTNSEWEKSRVCFVLTE